MTPFQLPLAHLFTFSHVVFTNKHILSFQHFQLISLWKHASSAFEDHPSNAVRRCCFDTYSPWKQRNKVNTHTGVVSQFGNLSCTRGQRSPCLLHQQQQALLSWGKSRSVQPQGSLRGTYDSPVCLPSFLSLSISLPWTSFTHRPLVILNYTSRLCLKLGFIIETLT